MTSLHLSPGHYTMVTHHDDGNVWVDLTDAGEHLLVEAARQVEAARFAPGNRTEWLRSLPAAELVELALGRWGGPEDDVLEESLRRIQKLGETLRPALTAMRAAGLIDQAPDEPAADGAPAAAGGGE